MSEMPPENPPEMPPDPWINQDMMPLAKSAYDMFIAFIAAGFAEYQAIQIVTGVIMGIIRSTVPNAN